MITAAYGPHLDGDRTKTGFTDDAAAEEYIRTFCCEGCLKEAEQGFHIVTEPAVGDEDPKEHKLPTENIFATSCGAEWLILSDENWQEFLAKPNLDVGFLYESAGYKVQKD
jgi:hypothetical protein